MICKDTHLHVSQHKIDISEDKTINSGIKTPNMRSFTEGKDRNCSKQSDANRQKSTTLDSKGKDDDKDNDGFDLFYK